MDWFTRIWLPIAIAVTGLCLIVYVVQQQSYRQLLNDPQIQLAEDAAAALSNGADSNSIVATGTKAVDIATSLRPYTVIYDKNIAPIAWSGTLDGKPPLPPEGVFAAAKTAASGNGENRLSWQPKDGVRSAIVVVHVPKTDGYVLVGRNMRETENRIWQMQVLVGCAWITILAATLIASWLGARASAGTTGVVW